MDLVRASNRLARSQSNQLTNHELAEHQGEQECRHCRGHGPEGHIEKDVQPFNLLVQEMEVIHHGVISAGLYLANASKTRSIPAERLPLTKTRSPVETLLLRFSAASAADPTQTQFFNPAFCAASAIAAAFSPTTINPSMPK